MSYSTALNTAPADVGAMGRQQVERLRYTLRSLRSIVYDQGFDHRIMNRHFALHDNLTSTQDAKDRTLALLDACEERMDQLNATNLMP